MKRRALVWAFSVLAVAKLCQAQPPLSGHVKLIGLFQSSKEESFEAELGQESRLDAGLDFRLRLNKRVGAWRFEADYELLSQVGNQAEVRSLLDEEIGGLFDAPADSWFDLKKTIHDGDRSIAVHSLDRLSVSYTGAHLVARLGRQALSWGNGFAFRPLDLFEPFSFNDLDLEYKPGTDMVYSQWLFRSGADLEAVVIPRRALGTGNVESDLSSAALKMHFPGSTPVDAMLAEDWGDTVIGLGLSRAVGGAIWRLDATGTFVTQGRTVLSLVTNYDTATTWRNRSTSLFAEVYFNGFGVSNRGPSLADLPDDLAVRLRRGQLFVVNRFYALAGARVQWTPLLLINPSLIVNLTDASVFVSIEATRDLGSAYTLTARLEVPVGASGTEFGGLALDEGGPLFAPSTRLFARIARYF
jgi:hypothetical protein